ncbi:hypothetical protein BDZ94DRAFT_1239986 [Collybia nuda]|uniref:THO1-MOS11 C-terminal domain-containing protein n=1 Tax=Collybia nuda TaxID=64659 RepID=A0A9P5XWN7_9AGAR|nr:hypothetical protein BDZ94DRAFT_1239986 [Collybia nuda]
MDAKLKALKVVELKAILAQAKVQVPAKANKSDLISRIIASTHALDVYNKLHTQDDLLVPPADTRSVDWNSDQPSPEPKSPAVLKSDESPIADFDPISTGSISASTGVRVPDDPEAEKRRQRAARFGIPVVEPPKPQPSHAARNPSAPNGAKQAQSSNTISDDAEKLKARAARFGVPQAIAIGQKRSAPSEIVNPEEAEKRRRRAERFGTGFVI